MRKVFLLLVVTSLLIGCAEYVESKETTIDGDAKIHLLFEHDGCKMYRFNDGGRYIYWSDCRGKTQADYTTHNGKTTIQHYEETITTE